GKRFDLQLKGSGITSFSRGGDGRSSLGPVIREYILSEAMHGLGVPTTRALAIVSTGELVHREKSFPGAIFTRVASSHIRVGTFQYFAAKGDVESVKTLLDYAIERHYPEIVTDHAISFLRAVIRKQISLVTHWMSLGFIHGVMNTDNMSISGETLDYGPCAFMDKFSHGKVFSSIDQNGRYAYNNQGNILLWNMARLAECLKPLVHADDQTAVKLLNKELESVSEDFQCELDKKMTAKLGLKSDNVDLINQFLNLLEQEGLDFTLSFRNICSLDSTHKSAGMMTFYNTWKQKLTADGTTIEKVAEKIRKVSPLYIPRNHQVELAIQGAMNDDLTVFNDINKVMQRPFEFQSQLDRYSLAPVPSEEVVATFCGT
ncbi:MAG: hypothetical protein HON90_08500, partial [Halobacteriovoraceae bacterium]|nr:hypothetical protein [Halobacteriovoraceae bacterium]